jgi:RNA polymerase subunit RPABC4/transcription elongation factor Spt4
VVEFFFYFVYRLSQAIQPILVPVCIVFAWASVLFTAWSVWSAVRDGLANARRMHQIPCADCQFFTNSHYLKCPVHPDIALSEDAIGCIDFEPNTSSGYSTQMLP